MLKHYKTQLFILLTACICTGYSASGQIINTIAGNGTSSYCGDNIQATTACLQGPSGVAVDGNGNVYIADAANHRVRMVNTSGVITTIAGTGTAAFSGDGGPATSAALNTPRAIAVDFFGNVFIADEGNHRIRKIDQQGDISTIAGTSTAGFSGDGGPASVASLNGPSGVAVDFSGNIYIADQLNHRIRMISFIGQIISTIAGNGTPAYTGDGGLATQASLHYPSGVTMDMNGFIYIADNYNHAIRKIDLSSIITTVAGNGTDGYTGDGGQATIASLNFPYSVSVDAGDNIYIADQLNNAIRKVDVNGIITTFAGTGNFGFSGDGGPATSAMLYYPLGVAVLGSSDIYIADASNHRVRAVTNCPLPVQPGPISGSTYVCPGSQYTYSISSVVNATSYVWNLPSGWTGTSNTEIITATAGQSGTISVYAVNSCGNGPVETLGISLLPVPSITPSGPVNLCTGGSVVLNATPGVGSGITHQWLENNTVINGATNATFTAQAAGSYTVVVSAGTCSDTSLATTVTVNPIPVASHTASGPLTFCAGDNVVFSASPTTGVTYQWLLNNSDIAGATAGTFTASTSGLYSVEVTASGCSDTSVQSTVTVNPLPAVTISQTGNVLTATSGFSSYQWYLNGSPIPGATSSTYTITQGGGYYVIVSDGNCEGQSLTLTPTLSVPNLEHDGAFSLYPNPNEGIFTIAGQMKTLSQEAAVTVTDILGRQWFATVLAVKSGKIDHSIQLPADLPAGFYTVKIVSGEMLQAVSFIKK